MTLGPADAAMDSGDVAECFNLFLGRAPEAEIARRCLDSGLSATLAALFDSDEFRVRVLAPLMLREPLPQEGLAQVPSLRLIDWVQRRLPIGPAARSMAGAARSWHQLLEVLLSDPELTGLAPGLLAAEVDRVLRERLATQPLSKAARAVIGAVDAVSALEIRGWALDLSRKEVPVTLEFYADNLFIGAVTCGDSRPDVKEAVGGDGRCGFLFTVPAARRASFGRGRTLIAIDSVSRERIAPGVEVRADLNAGMDLLSATRADMAQLREMLQRIEARLPDLGRLASVPLEGYGDYWERFYRCPPDLLGKQRTEAVTFAFRPLISVVLPTWRSDPRMLESAVESVKSQTYDRWELILCDDCSPPSDEIAQLFHQYEQDPRVRCIRGDERGGISRNTNRGLGVAHGDYVAFLDHDDEFAPDALFEVSRALQERPYGLLYSDEDRIEADPLGRLRHHSPFFKPGYDPDLLLSMNYICHLVVVRRDLAEAVGGLLPEFDGAQDHDFLLRVTERLKVTEIRHIPRILYHWRVTPGSVSRAPGSATAIQHSVNRAVQAHLDRRGCDAVVEAHADALGSARSFATRVRWRLPQQAPAVSVIIPTRDRLDLLRPCIDSVLQSAVRYPGRLEILVTDNDSAEPATREYLASLAALPSMRLTSFHGEFNWSAINNAAAREAGGEVLVFLNNDTVVLTDDWLAELAAHAIRPDVGVAGARLFYADGTIQHAGVVLGVEGVAGHDSVGEPPEWGGYFGRTHLQRSAAAVTGACMATRRSVFGRFGGFDETHFKVAFNDVDYCLRLWGAGYRTVYTPFCTLYHFESKSRGFDLTESKQARHRAEAAAFRARWPHIVDSDPYYNAHFERYARPFERLRSPP